MTLTKVNDNAIQLGGIPPNTGSYQVTVEVSVGNCKHEKTYTIKIYPLLESLVTTYLTGKNGLKVVDLNQTIKGGKPPYSCAFLNGNGRGTIPAGVQLNSGDNVNIQQSGCTLSGVPSNANKPGSYGFIMVVRDAFFQQVEIPVGYKHLSCNDSVFSITPSVDTIPVRKTGAAYNFEVNIKDLDRYIRQVNGQNQCYHSINLLLSLNGLSGAQNLSCTASDPVCVNCNAAETTCVTSPSGCPVTASAKQFIRIRQHAPIRSGRTKGPAFVTLEPTYSYTLNKSKTCHFDILERD